MANSWHDGKRFGSVRRLSSGRFQARYTFEAADHRAPRTFATKAEADTWLRIKHAELDTGTRLLAKPKRAGVVLADYSTRWLRERDLKPRTRVLYGELAVICEAMPEQLRALVLISAWAALRFGEATELRRRDVDGNVLHISRAVVRLPGEHIVGTPKSAAGVRSVTMPPHILEAVAGHLAAMGDNRPDALLFPADHGGNLATSTLNRHWHLAREAAGRPDLRWHDLRHIGAVLAAQTGATLAELMGRLGHSTPQAALRYQHAAQGRDAEIARRLSVLALGNDTTM